MQKPLLIAIDRDDTINEDPGYLGKEENWQSQIKIFPDVIQGLRLLKERLEVEHKLIVVTNQAGVARGYYPCALVEKINQTIDDQLKKAAIKIDSWQYCPYVDLEYAREKGLLESNPWVKETVLRKPQIGMLEKAAKSFGRKLDDFFVYVIGDKIVDVLTGINAKGKGILVSRKPNYDKTQWANLTKSYPYRVSKHKDMIGAALRIVGQQNEIQPSY